MKTLLFTILTIILFTGCQTSSFVSEPALYQKDSGSAFQVSSHHPTEEDAWTILPGETKVGEFVEKEFDVAEDGKYKIGINYILNDHNGIFQVEIDGVKIGKTVDGYSIDPFDAYLLCRNKAAGLKQLGELDLQKGKHKIKITVIGKNENSKNYYVLIDCVSVKK